MAFIDKIFNKRTLNEDTNELLKSLTNFTSEDFETLKQIASGAYPREPERDPVTKSFLDLVERTYTRTQEYGESSPQTRKQLYRIYDEMDDSVAYISAALDIISDDATQPDQDGVIIRVSSESEKVKTLTQDLIDDFEIEEKIAMWARLVAKYGDFFIKIDYKDGEGITKIQDNIYPSRVERKDLDGELIAFASTEDSITGRFYPPWDYVHFKHKGDISKDQDKLNNLQDSTAEEHDLNSSYGQSILKPAIKVYAQLRFVENMILLSRLTNSIRRNIFMINVGDVAPDKAHDTILNYANLLKKNVSLDLEQGIYNAQKKTVSYDEDIFIPVADPKNDVRIEQVGGDVNIAEQYDLEYLLNKLFSSLKIPKAYLNYEQDLNARATLVQLDIRYARSVSRLQQTLRGGLLRLAKINLAFHGLDPESVDLDIQLTPVSTIDTEAKRQEIKDKTEVANSIWRTLCDINEKLSGGQGSQPNSLGSILGSMTEGAEGHPENNTPVDLKFAAELILTEYMEFSAEDIDKLLKKTSGKSDDKSNFKTKTVVFHKVKASGPDLHAAYPTTEGVSNFERLKESYLYKKELQEN